MKIVLGCTLTVADGKLLSNSRGLSSVRLLPTMVQHVCSCVCVCVCVCVFTNSL